MSTQGPGIGRLWKDARRRRKRRLPGKMQWLQIVRRTVQFSVLALLFLIPTLSLYDNLRNQNDDAAIQRNVGTSLVHSLVGDMDDHTTLTQTVRGSVWTFKAGGLVMSDPLAGVDFAAASRSAWDPFFLTLLIPLVFTLLLGRVFCGWICPADLLFEFASKLRAIAGIETNVQFSRLTKYAILGIGTVSAFWLGTQVFAEIYPPRVLSGELYLWISFGLFGAGTWFLIALVFFEVFVSERFWCRSVCPGGALYSLLGRFRVLRIKVKESACTSCEKCQPVCEFGLDPMKGEMGQECNNCGLCIRACAPKALVYQLGLPKKGLSVLP